MKNQGSDNETEEIISELNEVLKAQKNNKINERVSNKSIRTFRYKS